MEYSIRTALVAILIIIVVVILLGVVFGWFESGDKLVQSLFGWIETSTVGDTNPW